MLDNIEVLYHSSIRMNKEKIIYIDPFKIERNYNDADIIFITHDHFDHFSEEDLVKVMKKDSIIVMPFGIKEKAINLGFENIIEIKPYEEKAIDNIKFETIPAYNVNKQFHPKENNWVGYIITIDDVRYYIAGDTDANDDNRKVKCDVAFVPVGGTYTMTYEEAAKLINEIKPKIAVPIHYGSVAGTKQDGLDFVSLLDQDIDGIILMN